MQFTHPWVRNRKNTLPRGPKVERRDVEPVDGAGEFRAWCEEGVFRRDIRLSSDRSCAWGPTHALYASRDGLTAFRAASRAGCTGCPPPTAFTAPRTA
jgi:hypothetical protein